MRTEARQESFAAGHELIPEEAPETVYGGQNSAASIGCIVGGIALVLLEIYLVQQVLDGQIRGKMAMLPWLLPLLIGFFLIHGLSNLLNPITVAVYPHGFSYQRGRPLDFCTWERISTIWSYQYCVPDAVPRYKFWVTRDDGALFAFNNGRLNDVEELAGRIYAQVRDRFLAPALAAYSAGDPVEFGPIAIDRTGLTYRGEHLTWTQIVEAGPDAESDFVVRKQGKVYAWCELSTKHIPNFWIFQELLDQRYPGATA